MSPQRILALLAILCAVAALAGVATPVPLLTVAVLLVAIAVAI